MLVRPPSSFPDRDRRPRADWGSIAFAARRALVVDACLAVDREPVCARRSRAGRSMPRRMTCCRRHGGPDGPCRSPSAEHRPAEACRAQASPTAHHGRGRHEGTIVTRGGTGASHHVVGGHPLGAARAGDSSSRRRRCSTASLDLHAAGRCARTSTVGEAVDRLSAFVRARCPSDHHVRGRARSPDVAHQPPAPARGTALMEA